MKCPFCQQYSLTYEWITNTWTCQVYNATTADDRMPVRLPIPNYRRTQPKTRWFNSIGRYVTRA